jgi:hypothetical protein
MVAAFIISAVVPAHAQDGRDEIIARLTALNENWKPADQQSEFTITTTTSGTITVMGQAVSISDETIAEGTRTVINLEDGTKNRQLTFTLTFSSTQLSALGNQATKYAIEGEMRFVDGVLYLMAAYTEGGDLAEVALPEGWVEVTPEELEAGVYSMFDIFDLDELFEDDDEEDEDAFARLVRYLEDDPDAEVTQVAETLEDGTAVDTIAITFGEQTFITSYQENMDEANPMAELMLEAMTDASYLKATVSIGEGDIPQSAIFESSITISELDMNAADPEQFPEGTLMNTFSQTEIETNRLLSHDTGLTIEAPEMEMAN